MTDDAMTDHNPTTDAELALYRTFLRDGVDEFNGELLAEVIARLDAAERARDEAVARAEAAEARVRLRERQQVQSTHYWMRAAREALDGNTLELLMRVASHDAPPVEVVLSAADAIERREHVTPAAEGAQTTVADLTVKVPLTDVYPGAKGGGYDQFYTDMPVGTTGWPVPKAPDSLVAEGIVYARFTPPAAEGAGE